MNILELLNEPGDFVEGRIVSTHPSPKEPSHYGIVTFDNGLSVDLDYADNLRREMDGILDAYYEENPGGQPFVRIVAIDPIEIARPDKDFTPKFAHAVILNPEGV
jgi:hypothetical protein